MNKLIHPFAVAVLVASPASFAIDAACEPFLAAAEKTAAQPTRHSVVLLDDGSRIESIFIDGRFYTAMDGQWRLMKIDLRAAEQGINADLRSGKHQLGACRELGQESVDGIATRVISYTVTMKGAPPAAAKAYIGRDGLVHALSADGQKVRYRYSGVSAPVLK